MRVLKRLQDASDVRRLRRRVQEDPSPQSLVDLCRRMQRQGRAASALECARHGLARFPNSAELRDILRAAWKIESGKMIAELEAAIDENPVPDSHAELIAFYLDFDEIDLAEKAAAELVAEFRNSAEASMVQAQVYLERFQRDHVASDGSIGIRCLQRAMELEPDALDPHLALAEVYAYIGAVSRALFHVYKAMDIDPHHEAANTLYEALIKLPLEKETEGELLRQIEETDQGHLEWFVGGKRDEAKESARHRMATKGLERLTDVSGVRRAAFSHHETDLIAIDGHCIDLDTEPSDFLDRAVMFRRAASLSAKRMGIGAFREAEMSWQGGAVLTYGAGSTVLALETDSVSRQGKIRSEAGNFLAACTPAVREEGS